MSLKLSDNAIKVLEARYLKRDEERKIIETPEEIFARIAKGIAHAELLFGSTRAADYWEEEFYNLLTSFDFLPNSPTIMNAGTSLGQLSACFVIPVEDTMEDIFQALRDMAIVQRTGGGTGFSFSKLRPKGDIVASTGGEASGPVSFMKIFDCATENIKQGGKRRGANMGILRVDHPDIMEFITAKREESILTNFNVSVGITDSFMQNLKEDRDYKLINPRTKKVVKRLKARRVFDAIVENAWETGDPGLVFLDTTNRAQPTPEIGSIESTNPCGEVPLLSYESCNLASINLSHMLKENKDKKSIDREKLKITTHKVIRFLDDVIEVNEFPIPQTEHITKGNRKIGLGVMGFAEMLISLKIPYDSGEAVTLAGELMYFIAQEALKASMNLAKERGIFPFWEKSIYANKGIKVRNATRTSIAPTGTISIIAGTTTGIEPLFAIAYTRAHVLGEERLIEVNPIFLNYTIRDGFYSEELIQRIAKAGSIKNIRDIPEDIKRVFVTALEVPVEQHIRIQAAFQKYVDNSVSKTINIPHESTPGDVRKAYLLAYKLGCKGITIYRYGSLKEQILELGVEEKVFEREHYSKCDPEACRIP